MYKYSNNETEEFVKWLDADIETKRAIEKLGEITCSETESYGDCIWSFGDKLYDATVDCFKNDDEQTKAFISRVDFYEVAADILIGMGVI